MKPWQWLFIAFFTLGLIGVRFLETKLFYDPFLAYFKGANTHYPHFDWAKIIISHWFRFLLNLLFSLGIIHSFFLNKKWTFQAGIIILVSFVIVLPFYLYSIGNEMRFGELFTFYLRRILIQPVMVLILIPVLYYLKIKNLSDEDNAS